MGVTLQDIYTLVCPPGTGNVNWTYFDKKAWHGPGPGNNLGTNSCVWPNQGNMERARVLLFDVKSLKIK